jgi:hypothetical protein
MKTVKALAALIACTAMFSTAHASVIDLGTVAGTTYLEGLLSPGSFSDTYAFSLSSTSDIEAAFKKVYGINNFKWTLDEFENGKYVSLGKHPSFNDLGSGLYEFVFTGFAAKPVSVYFGGFRVAAVPEADTWLMLLVGAGLLAYQLRRRGKALRHSLTA